MERVYLCYSANHAKVVISSRQNPFMSDVGAGNDATEFSAFQLTTKSVVTDLRLLLLLLAVVSTAAL